jgi:hypothetical protein
MSEALKPIAPLRELISQRFAFRGCQTVGDWGLFRFPLRFQQAPFDRFLFGDRVLQFGRLLREPPRFLGKGVRLFLECFQFLAKGGEIVHTGYCKQPLQNDGVK